MCFIRWEPAHSVHNEELDRQHMRLVDLVNSLHDAMLTCTPRPAMDRIVSDLVMYARFHFRKEEALLRDLGYPSLDEHIEQHAGFTMEIDQFIGDLTAGQNEIPESLVGFLKTWLDKHLCVSDAGYAQYLNTRRAA